VLWIALSYFLLSGYYRQRRRWTELRLDAPHHLVEQMVGHQTRLAQEIPGHRHQGEDEMLERYLAPSSKP